MTFGEWGDQASSEGSHKFFCECCKKHLTCVNWGATSILQHIKKPGHILNHKDRTDTSQKRFILSISAHSRHSIQKPQALHLLSITTAAPTLGTATKMCQAKHHISSVTLLRPLRALHPEALSKASHLLCNTIAPTQGTPSRIPKQSITSPL